MKTPAFIAALERRKELRRLRRELDEAHRKVGELQLEKERWRDSEWRRDQWLRKAKQDAGFNTMVSFDVVWEEALFALKRERERGGLA